MPDVDATRPDPDVAGSSAAGSAQADETALPVVSMRRPRWGDPEVTVSAPEAATALGGGAATPSVDARSLAPGASRLSDEAREALGSALGAEYVCETAEVRVQHTRGYSTPDLLRMRAGDVDDAPDAVVLPATDDEVVAVLRTCAEHRVAVVPFTGGTSVVGGLTPDRSTCAAVVSVDLQRLSGLLELDEISRTATFAAGTRATAAEHALRARGYTLGHFPQSYEGAGIGGYAATRSAGQSSAGYGRFDEMVEGLVLATPRGVLATGAAPRSAAGPDLRQLILGSEGVFGIITRVRLRIHPAPVARRFEGWRFGSFDEGSAALRRLAQDGPMPTVLRLSDETETALNLADPGQLGAGGTGSADSAGALAVVGFEGTHEDVRRRRDQVASVLADCGGAALGAEPGEAWRAGRFRAPYLRDPLLDTGVFVETLETVAYWSTLAELRATVTATLVDVLSAQGTPPLVLCHISHVYHSGASLYFTVVAPFADEPLEAWASAKKAVNSAIRSVGASITHHHGVGRDHRDGYHDEVGELGLAALRAVKQSLDPDGVCNPGVLL